MEKKGERGKQHRRTPDECRQRRTEKRASPADQGGGATGDEAGARALACHCFYMFLSHLLLQTSPGAREYHAVVTTGLVKRHAKEG
ncbi:hypothetical protein NC652_037529 [Populus alba x Populus x berolinensis]|nr:hypothetical protein NC652_037529 [Populus alba x Populus x berolinensis]